MDRGVILCPPIRLNEEGIPYIRASRASLDENGRPYIRDTGLTYDDVRFFLLYWDRIDYPGGAIVDVENLAINEAVELGVAIRTEINTGIYQHVITGKVLLETLVAVQWGAFKVHEEREPGKWSIGQISPQLIAAPSLPTQRSLEIDLYKALPSVGADVRLDEVLEFHAHNAAQLARLREKLDVLYLDLVRSGDLARARIFAEGQIAREIRDLQDRLAKQGMRPVPRRSFKMTFSGPDLLKELALRAVEASVLGLAVFTRDSTWISIAATRIVGAGVKIAIREAPQLPDSTVRDSPYAYAVQAAHELA